MDFEVDDAHSGEQLGQLDGKLGWTPGEESLLALRIALLKGIGIASPCTEVPIDILGLAQRTGWAIFTSAIDELGTAPRTAAIERRIDRWCGRWRSAWLTGGQLKREGENRRAQPFESGLSHGAVSIRLAAP